MSQFFIGTALQAFGYGLVEALKNGLVVLSRSLVSWVVLHHRVMG